MLGFWGEPNEFEEKTQNKVGDWDGLRFENVNYMFAHTRGWANRLIGDDDTRIKKWTFKNVRINGELLDAALMADPSIFKTKNVSEMRFEP